MFTARLISGIILVILSIFVVTAGGNVSFCRNQPDFSDWII